MKIVAITNTINRPVDLVTRSLEASLSQKNFDNVILIDQNEPPIELPTTIANNPKLIRKNINVRCVSEARNAAPIPKDTDWLVFCDDDGYVKEDYSETLISLMNSNPDVDIYAGSIVNDDDHNFYSYRHAIGGDLNLFKNSKLLMGSNFCTRYITFKELKGFDEDFGAGGFWGSGEETDFAWKAIFSNKRLKYTKDLVVYHGRPYIGSYTNSIKKAFRYGIGKGALVAKWLFSNKKIKVLFEAFEMMVIPLIRSLIDILKMKPQMTLVHLSSLTGRIVGLFRYLMK